MTVHLPLAALHDVGKVSPGFQGKCLSWSRTRGLTSEAFVGSETDHAKIGQRSLQQRMGRDELRFWSAIVGAHHGRLKGDRLPPLCDGGPEWERERQRLIDVLVAEFGPLPQDPAGHNDAALWFNAGLIAVADWLASDERAFPCDETMGDADLRARAGRQVDRLGLGPVACASGKRFAELFPFEPNALQAALAHAVRAPGVYVVEASMGGGKTEAALMAAYNLIADGHATGLYFALPTRTTSQRIHRRVADFVDRAAPGAGARLIHGRSWLSQPEAPVVGRLEADTRAGECPYDGRDWFASSRRALLAPFGVGTVDQALLGVVASKHFFVRQFALAGKVVILDEVHTYDLYTGTLIDVLVERLRGLGATVIVLTATLTVSRRRQLLGLDTASTRDDYPLISASVDGEALARPVPAEPPKSVHVAFRRPDALADEILRRASAGQCVLWIRNTVNDAQESYRQLRSANREGGPEIALLHARFPHFRREELEEEWLARLGKDSSRRPPRGCVLVSTQIAEQSVDIDADLLVTELAPTDMLLQRIGRLWRHPRPRPEDCRAPECWISSPAMDWDALRAASPETIGKAFGRSSKVYAPYVLLRTLGEWRGIARLTLPADIRPLLEATYGVRTDDPPAWRELFEAMEARKRSMRSRALDNSNPWQLALDDEEDVQTRWGGCPTASVVLVGKVFAWDSKKGARFELLDGEKCATRAERFDYGVAKAIHRNTVDVPRWCVDESLGRAPDWLRQYIAGDPLACKVRDGRLVALPGGEDTGLGYRDDMGVVLPSRPERGRRRGKPEEGDDESYDW